MRLFGSLGRLVVVGLFASAVAVTACGGGAAQAPGPVTPTAKEVSSLKCRLGHSQSSKVDQALQAALMSAGYTIVTDGDADVELAPTVQAKPTVMAININGKQKLDITVTLNVSSNGQMVDQVTSTFSNTEEDVTADDLKALVSQLNAHGKLASFARDQQGKAAAEAKAKADKEQAEEDAAWKDAQPEACTTPTKRDACQKLQSWLERHATSPHADEARKILKESEAKLAALEDDQAWAEAKADDCKTPKDSGACQGVDNYMRSYPNGGHVAEAKAMMQASAPKIAQLKASESAAQKQADLEDCQKTCKTDTCQWLMGSARYQVCVANCFQSCQ